MKRLIIIIALTMGAIASSLTADAQFRFGLKAGVAVNKLHFNLDTFDPKNRTDFTGGVMIEFTVPVTGLGFDLSAMYVRRDTRWIENEFATPDRRDYIEVPVNFKWKINIPVLNAVARPYLFTGPTFAFLTSRKAVSEAIKDKRFDSSWNFGFGVEIVKHLQIGASYNMGMDKTLEKIGLSGSSPTAIVATNRGWTVTAAYLF